MRILIVTYFFPPLNRIASLRPYSWAKYWSRLGHDVYVITKQKTSEDGPLNMDNIYELKNVSILELKAWPFRLKKMENENSNGGNRIAGKLLDYLKAIRVLLQRDFWGFSACKIIDQIHRAHPFDAIVSTYGPYGGHVISSWLKMKYHIPWVADYRDLWHGNHARPKPWPISVVEDRFEKYFVRRADLITTVSEGLNQKLSRRFNCTVVTIENGFDQDDLLGIDGTSIFPDDGKMRIAYTGTIYKNFQDPSPLFEALLMLKENGFPVEEKIEVLFYGSRLGNLADLISHYDLEAIVKTPGFVSRKDSLRIQRNVDLLLFLEWDGPAGEDILTGKLFEYLFSGRPIISIGGNPGEPAKLIETSGAGLVLGKSPDHIADILQKVAGGYQINHGPPEDQLERYSREYLAEKMLKLVVNSIGQK